MSVEVADVQYHWNALRPMLTIRNEEEYHGAVEHMNALLDEIGTDEDHPLYELLDAMGTLINAYEEEHEPIPASDPCQVLQYLMDEHQLRQSDLPEVGSQGIVSEILNGKRQLNVRQIRLLSQRFGVSPAVFM